MHFGNLIARVSAANSVARPSTVPLHYSNFEARNTDMKCDHLCKQKILYTNTDDAARLAVSLAMQAHQSGAWCDSQDWCPGTINSTCSMITSKIVKEAIPSLKECDTECFINVMGSSMQKSSYWAGSWADKALSTTSEGRTVDHEALNRLNTTLQYLELIPAESIVNRTALDEVMRSPHALPLPVLGPAPASARPKNGTKHDKCKKKEKKDKHDKCGLQPWEIELAAGLGAGIPIALGTAAGSTWALGSWLYANNVRYSLMVDDVVSESSWIRTLFRPREVNTPSTGPPVTDPWPDPLIPDPNDPDVPEGPEPPETPEPPVEPLTPEELLEEEEWRIAQEAAKNMARQQSLRLQEKPEKFENAFKEKLPASPKDYPAERILRTELYNQETGVMENALVKEIKWDGPMKQGYMYKQGFRRFRRCNAKGKELKFKVTDADGEVFEIFRDSWMKPGHLQPLNNAYWQGVAAEAGSALEGTTSILRTTEGIVLDSLGQPISKVGDSIVNVKPVERVGNAVSFALEKNTELVFEAGDLAGAALDGATALLGAAGDLLSIDVFGNGEGDSAPRLVKRPSPPPQAGHGDDPSSTTTSHTATSHSSSPNDPTMSHESTTSSTYGTPSTSGPMSTSYRSSSSSSVRLSLTTSTSRYLSATSSTIRDPGIKTSYTSTTTSTSVRSSAPSTLSTITTTSTSPTDPIVPNSNPPNSTLPIESLLPAGIQNVPLPSLPAGLQNDPTVPYTKCCSDYAGWCESFQIQGFNWEPQNLKKRIEHCGAVTLWEFGQLEGMNSWWAKGNTILQKLHHDDMKCIHHALMKAGGPDVKCKVNCDDFGPLHPDVIEPGEVVDLHSGGD
ncbi:hypothetical protein HII31_12200 [Pseudocercospora fuligena]|uniref:Uncharacterized protein n=1 Tax=Pseudocercospora fuligena TaxID=685502 RepID=A0A8H6R8K6_9PEZI|nr:hypothetical protein HII31_12200 [Pseudocercospora fuligena]